MSALSRSLPRGREALAPSAFLVLSAVLLATFGIPYHRDILAVWLLIGLLCFSMSDLRGAVRGIVLEWLPFAAILIVYDSLRGTAGHIFAVHYLPQLQVDQWLFGGTAPTVTLQHWLWHGHVVWYDVVFWGIYLTHFVATPLVATVLWKVDRARFRWFAVFVTVLSFTGLLTYALFPAAPPWMASDAHMITPVARIVPMVWPALGLHSAGSLIEHGYHYANNVAAIPSLHTAFALLIAIALWPRKHKWLRPLVALYPVAMAFSLIVGAEHYVFDVLLGWIYTFASLGITKLLMRWWANRRRQGTVAPAPAGALRGGLPEPVYAES